MEYVYYVGVGLPLSNDNYEYKVWNNISMAQCKTSEDPVC